MLFWKVSKSRVNRPFVPGVSHPLGFFLCDVWTGVFVSRKIFTSINHSKTDVNFGHYKKYLKYEKPLLLVALVTGPRTCSEDSTLGDDKQIWSFGRFALSSTETAGYNCQINNNAMNIWKYALKRAGETACLKIEHMVLRGHFWY